MPQLSSSTDESPKAESPTRPPASRSVLTCSVLGTIGWLGLIPCLSSCDQSEQLARYFAGFFNLILLGVVGDLSTVLLYLAHPILKKQPASQLPHTAPLSHRIATFGMFVGAAVIILYLPVSIWVML